ncbi:uncharacterized protein LOC115626235 [Scaptodrosophila lebanonensis]|uniref:Uncharacterized protein LOC115626235 n=1 Tax=Drosophila lebanonensis TaxID=7225 RepID=A0A6J2TMY8_DROLE|nr:uncharacterized protein LOC115626235 [Scaptodrosophila lebanonensis]
MRSTCRSLCLWLCLYFGASTGLAMIAPRCKSPYVRVRENYCYYVDHQTMHTSFSNFCYSDKRTSRVCLDSVEEMRALASYLYESGYHDGSQFWSAGNRWAGDLQFYWNYFGRARALNYTNWEPDQPTPTMGLNCMLLTLNRGELVMSSESCYTEAIDICEQLLSNEPLVIH